MNSKEKNASGHLHYKLTLYSGVESSEAFLIFMRRDGISGSKGINKYEKLPPGYPDRQSY
jgi:hypothetical protein